MIQFFQRAAVLMCVALLGACSAPEGQSVGEGKASVVASTPILADAVQNVAGDVADVHTLMARGVDPHSYEPSLHATRDIAYADAIFTNGLLLEPQSLTNTIAATVRDTTPVVALAQEAQRYGFAPIPLVEDASLDAVWLGLRVDTGQQLPTTGVADLHLVDVDGPGATFAFILGTFGTPEVVFNSHDGLDSRDVKTLPVDAHTHLSWAFSKPGVYKLTFESHIRDAVGAPEHASAESTVTVVVGQDPARVTPGLHAVEKGHVDITTELDGQGAAHLVLNSDDDGRMDPVNVAVTVPNTTLQPIPPERPFRFLGTPGEETYLLPQAVLGNHVHGELDPHVWHDVRAMKAIVQVIRDELAAVDPHHAEIYQANARDYLQKLDAADEMMHESVSAVPEEQRNLVTTHHGYAYLARAYGMRVAGFVTPNPSVEPSPRDVIAFTRTLENLHVPAVFLEPQLAGRSTVLTETAAQLGIDVCPIWGDTLDPPGSGPADTYIHLVEANAASIRGCLGRNEK